MAAFLILSGLMIGVFSALDGMLFYVFFGHAVPMAPDHRHVGWSRARSTGVQVLPVYLAGLAV